MNYVWAQQGMEEHREQSETIAVPSLDLREKEREREREVLEGKWGSVTEKLRGFQGRKTEEETRGKNKILLRKNSYSINATRYSLQIQSFSVHCSLSF